MEASKVEEWGLSPKKLKDKRRFSSRLFPGAEFSPEESVVLTLLIKPANVRVTLEALVLPKGRDSSQEGQERSHIIVGDVDIKRLGLRGLVGAEREVFTPAMPAEEVLSTLAAQLEEGARLELMGGIESERGTTYTFHISPANRKCT